MSEMVIELVKSNSVATIADVCGFGFELKYYNEDGGTSFVFTKDVFVLLCNHDTSSKKAAKFYDKR